MTYQIIILNSSVQPDNSFYVNGVFWLTANANNIVPLPTFVSQVPFADITDLGMLQTGVLVEQGFNSGLFPAGTTLSTVQSTLQSLYTTAQTNLGLLNPPLAQMVGTAFNGSSWTTSSPFSEVFQNTITGNLGSLNATLQIGVTGQQSVGLQVEAGTFIGTIVPEVSFDNGTTWTQTLFSTIGYSDKIVGLSFASANTAYALTIIVNGGVGLVRVRVFAYTSGSCSATLSATNINDQTLQLFTGQPGSAMTPNVAVTGGSVTTAAPTYTTGLINALSLNTSGGLRVDGSGVTQPVSGTVSATQGTSPYVDNVTQFGSTNISTGTGAGGAGIPRVTVSNDSNVLATQSGTWTVQPGNTPNTSPWLATINQGGNSAGVTAKGTQATNALAVQELKDSGRVAFFAVANALAGVTTEALVTLTPIRTVTAGATGTSLAVTAGKTMHLQTLVLTVRNTSTVQSSAVIRVRMLAGTVLVGSQEFFSVACTVGDAVTGGVASTSLILPDGVEISGTTQIGITQLASATTCTLEISLIGFEY